MRSWNLLASPVATASASLALGSAAASAVGFLFWWLASHRVEPAELGIASSLVGAIGLLSVAGKLGFDLGYLRYAPVTPDPARLLNHALVACGLVTSGLSVAFILLAPLLLPSLAPPLRDGPTLAAFLVAAVFGALAYVLAGALLHGGHHRAVFLHTVGAALLRLVALLVLVGLGSVGVVLAWAASMVAVSLGGALVALPRLQPGYRFAPGLRAVREPEGFLSFSLWNNLVVLCEAAAALVLPLVVIGSLGPEPAGRFYIALMLANIAWIIPASAATAFLSKGARERDRMGAELSRVRRLVLLLLVPAVAGTWLLGDLVLGAFGTGGGAEGRILLTLLVASAMPLTVIRLAGARFRLLDQTRANLLVSLLATVAGIGLPLLAAPRFGLVGIGAAWLLAQGLVAALVLVHERSARRQE